MSLKIFENKWRKNLTRMLEELSNSEYKKMLFSLDEIPKKLKTGRSREEMPQRFIELYGAKQSVLEMEKIMNEIPRRDAAVQDLLRVFVDQVKKKRQTKNKDKKERSKHNKIDPGKPEKSKQKKTGTKAKVQSDAVQTVKIKITKIIKSTKAKFHLEAGNKYNRQQTFVVTPRRLAKGLGFKLEDDLKEKLLHLMPLSAEAKIRGNTITEMKTL